MSSTQKSMGLVLLCNNSDMDLRLVELFVMDWIEQPYAPPVLSQSSPYSYNEMLLPQMQDEFRKWGSTLTSVTVSSGSWSNDRALSAPGQSFSSVLEMLDYVQQHGIKVTREYQGCIY